MVANIDRIVTKEFFSCDKLRMGGAVVLLSALGGWFEICSAIKKMNKHCALSPHETITIKGNLDKTQIDIIQSKLWATAMNLCLVSVDIKLMPEIIAA